MAEDGCMLQAWWATGASERRPRSWNSQAHGRSGQASGLHNSDRYGADVGTKTATSQDRLQRLSMLTGEAEVDEAGEQADEADEARGVAWRSMVLGAFRGRVRIMDGTRRSRASQLIRGVRRTKRPGARRPA